MNLTEWSSDSSIAEVVNLSSVDRFYFAGIITSLAAIQNLVASGVTTFIDLKKADEALGSINDSRWVRDSNANYFYRPVSNPAEDIDFSFNEKMKSIIDSADGKIVIYCMSSNRVGYWFGRYLIEVVGLAKAKAFEYALKAGLKNEASIEKFKEQAGL